MYTNQLSSTVGNSVSALQYTSREHDQNREAAVTHARVPLLAHPIDGLMLGYWGEEIAAGTTAELQRSSRRECGIVVYITVVFLFFVVTVAFRRTCQRDRGTCVVVSSWNECSSAAANYSSECRYTGKCANRAVLLEQDFAQALPEFSELRDAKIAL